MKGFWKLFQQLTGWKAASPFPHLYNQYILLVAPHTSSWDFIVGLSFRSTLNLQDIHFLGKAELFRPPFGRWFRALGGIPVERSRHTGLVEQVVAYFRKDPQFKLALAPEGSRKKVDELKTGFYHIAKAANVPVILAGLDFKKKILQFSDYYWMTDDVSHDMQQIVQFFATFTGKNPDKDLRHFTTES